MPTSAWLTFDCYGTLIDWRAGISEAVLRAATEAGVPLSAERVLELHRRIEPEVQRGPYRPYRAVLTAVAEGIARETGWSLSPGGCAYLPESLPSWPPFGDTNRALLALKQAGYALGILSNVDDDLLAGTLRHFEVEFDLLVTAQQVTSYKPGEAHFLRARERIGGAAWVHVAQSYFHDIEPAAALGIPTVWVNRLGEAPAGTARANATIPDLDALPDTLASGLAGTMENA